MKRDKRQPRIETTIRFLHPTSDSWSPSFGQEHRYDNPPVTSFLCNVEFRVHLYYNPDKVGIITDGLIRICVSGADDTGMEKDIRVSVSEYPAKLEEIRYLVRA